MIFFDNENLTLLNKELWIIPILMLIILLYIFRSKKYKKIILALSILYTLFLLYNLYFIFLPLFTIKGTFYYFVQYPYGFVLLALTLFLIANIIFPNKYSSYIAVILTLVVAFNQVYLRVQTSKINDEYKNILENKGMGNILLYS